MIISGFAGIGKSTLAKKSYEVIDLESSIFKKDWELYSETAKYLDEQGYDVLISAHKEIRTKLHDKGIKYTFILPSNTEKSKSEYLDRYRLRGNTDSFIYNMMNNWNSYHDILPWENDVVTLRDGDYLSDWYYSIDSYNNVFDGF